MRKKFDNKVIKLLLIIKKKEFNINTNKNEKIGMTFESLAGFIAYSLTQTHIIEWPSWQGNTSQSHNIVL